MTLKTAGVVASLVKVSVAVKVAYALAGVGLSVLLGYLIYQMVKKNQSELVMDDNDCPMPGTVL